MPVEKKHIAIVCNPHAGRGKSLQIADKIVNRLKIKHEVFSLFTAHWPQHWNEITEVWIIGGDGTLNYFINQYPDIIIPLSIFKGGTGNDFQELLYGRIALEEQIEQVLNGSAHWVDAGKCNGRLFLNGVGIGFDGAVVNDLWSRKKTKTRSSYLFSISKNILAYREKKYFLEFDERSISQDCFMVNVANGKSYGGGFKVAPEASVEDGKLDLNIVERINPLKRLYYIPIIKKGKHVPLSFIQYYQTTKVKISSPVTLPAHMDGEYFKSSKFFIECLPKRFSFLW